MNNKIISKEMLKTLIEPHFHKYLELDAYEILNVSPVSLMRYNRLDIAFKLIYLELCNDNPAYAKQIYNDHIRAFTLGGFTEPGNKKKNSFDKYVIEFRDLFSSIIESGFDGDKSIIPLASNGSILNGSHRIACAIHAGSDIDCVKLNSDEYNYDYRFFQDRSVPQAYLEHAVTKFIEITTNVYIALIWPSALGKDKELDAIINNVVYKKKIILNGNGAHNLLSQVYHDEKWLGTINDDYKGVMGKQAECFKNNNYLRIIAFQASSLDDVVEIKNKVREIFNIGKHSIHITDGKDETARIARAVYNENGVHFLNYAKPNRYLSTHARIKTIKDLLDSNNQDNRKFALDTGMTLSLYGLRDTADIDYLSMYEIILKKPARGIECHDDQLQYHGVEKNELINNPMYYFYFDDIKFISFNQVYKMKKNRSEVKDLNDIMMMEGLLENNYYKEYLSKTKQWIYYGKIKITKRIGSILKTVGLYHPIRKVYYKILKK